MEPLFDRMAEGHEVHRIEYSDEYDCYFCADCNVWLEPVANCGDDDCPYCSGVRPDRPLAEGGVQ